jgi:hypothetical protein
MHFMNATQRISTLVSALPLTPLAGLLAVLVVADADMGEAKPMAAIRNTNLRKAPAANSAILTSIPKGTPVEVVDCSNEWCRVSWNGQDGYAFARNLGIDLPPQWPSAAAVAWQGYDQKVRRLAGAHEDSDSEHAWVLELGGAGEWSLNGERPNFGGTISAEVEPLEDLLELEFGFTTLATAGHTELSGDLLFKKPFRLSPTVEFMFGAGPSFSRTVNGPDRGDAWAAEVALDWMFWPTKDVGWYVEPTWSVNPKNGQESIAVSIGLLIGFPK